MERWWRIKKAFQGSKGNYQNSNKKEKSLNSVSCSGSPALGDYTTIVWMMVWEAKDWWRCQQVQKGSQAIVFLNYYINILLGKEIFNIMEKLCILSFSPFHRSIYMASSLLCCRNWKEGKVFDHTFLLHLPHLRDKERVLHL